MSSVAEIITGHEEDLTHALNVVILAERLLQVHTRRADASLGQLGRPTRQRYEDAAAVALALLDDEAQRPALYAAAHRLVDLGAQTPLQRRGLVEMVGQVTQRYVAVLAGHHTTTVAALAPLVAIDARRDDAAPEGAL